MATGPPLHGRGRGRGRGLGADGKHLFHTIKWTFKQRPIASPRWCIATKANTDLENELDILMQDFMMLNDVPNAQLAVASGGKLLFARAYTLFSEPDSTQPQTTDASKFLLASCSKAFCAAAIDKLFPSPEVRSNTFLTKLVPKNEMFANYDKGWDEITIQHLIDHHAGFLKGKSGDWTHDMRGLKYAVLYKDKKPFVGSVMTAEEFLLDMSRWPLDYEPGKPPADPDNPGKELPMHELYSNAGYVILSRIVELKEKEYFKYLRDNFDFGPDLAVMPTKEEDFRRIQNDANIITPFSKEPAGPPSWDCSEEANEPDHWVAAEWGGNGTIREACQGSSSICCSASTLAKFAGKHAVWGAGQRTPGMSRMGTEEGAFSFVSSRDDHELDFAFTMNTRSFYGGRELACQRVAQGSKGGRTLVFSAEDTIASADHLKNPIHQLITKYSDSLNKWYGI